MNEEDKDRELRRLKMIEDVKFAVIRLEKLLEDFAKNMSINSSEIRMKVVEIEKEIIELQKNGMTQLEKKK
jgi:hypothetical protein